MTNWALVIKLLPVAAKTAKGFGAALRWLGSGIIRASIWAEGVYAELMGKYAASKSKEAK